VRNPDYNAWLLKDLWSVSEFVLLACQFDPEIGEGDDQVIHALDEDTQAWVQEKYAPCGCLSDLIRRSIAAGELKVMDYGYRLKDVAPPIDLIRWAIQKDVDMPLSLIDFERSFVADQPNYNGQPAKSRREMQKLRTKARNKALQEEYIRLMEEHPGQKGEWYAYKIKQVIAPGLAVETVRKNMKP